MADYSTHMYQQLLMSLLGGTNFIMAAEPYALLVGPGYSPDAEGHQSVDDVTASEISDANYSQQYIDTNGFEYDAVNGLLKLVTATEVSWTGLTTPARYAVIFDSNTGLLMGWVDFGTDTTGDISFAFPDGLIVLQRA